MTEFLTRLKRVRPPLSLVHKELPRLICTQLVQDPSSGQVNAHPHAHRSSNEHSTQDRMI